MDYLNSGNQISGLVQKIKKPELKKRSDILRAYGLSDLIYDEWLRLRNKFRENQLHKCKINQTVAYNTSLF